MRVCKCGGFGWESVNAELCARARVGVVDYGNRGLERNEGEVHEDVLDDDEEEEREPDYSLRTFAGHSASVMSLDFHPKKEDLCSCDSDSEIHYWSINHGSCISVFKGGATQMRFQPCVRRYLATVDENVVSILVETQICRHSLQRMSCEGLVASQWLMQYT